MRRPLVIANWKMHKRAGEAFQYVTELEKCLEGPHSAGGLSTSPPEAGGHDVEIVLAPPFTLIWMLRSVLSSAGGPDDQDARLALAGQDIHWEETGAYTGAIAASQLADLGCRYVLIGHSERRRHFGDTPEITGRKVRCAVSAGLWPVLCVGETREERDRGETRAVIARQVSEGLRRLAAHEMTVVAIAYEPVWAIGTGQAATPAQAVEVHRSIREQVAREFVPPDIHALRVLYGGSVTPEAVPAFIAEPEVDGFLVGGASLTAATFAGIIRAVEAAGRSSRKADPSGR